jgi:hypothetical protein
MKIKLIIITATIALLAGCATPVITPGTSSVTNSVTGVVTPATPASTNYAPNATATQIIGYGQAGAALLPSPYSGAATSLLGLATLILGAIAARRNGQLNTANQVTTAIIQGVESAGTAAAAVKLAVASVSKANGVSDAVEAAVNKVTGSQ